MSMVSRGVMIELVGLMAIDTSRSCPVLMPPSTPPALLVAKPLGVSESPCVGAALRDAGEARADLHALHRVDAHHGVGDLGVELVEQRLAQAHGHAAGGDADARAAGVAGLAQACPCSPPAPRRRRPARRNGLLGTWSQLSKGSAISPICCMQPRNTVPCASFGQPLLGDGAGRDHGRGQAGRGAAAAARVAQAVLLQVGVVGVAGAELLADLAVVLAALVGVADQQAMAVPVVRPS
jgi:hypothetical protein